MKSASFFCQSTCLVESGRAKISIASFVVVASAVEIDRAVQSLLKHCPPSTACFLDLKYIECTGIVRIDCINTADSLSSFVEYSTVQSCRLKARILQKKQPKKRLLVTLCSFESFLIMNTEGKRCLPISQSVWSLILFEIEYARSNRIFVRETVGE